MTLIDETREAKRLSSHSYIKAPLPKGVKWKNLYEAALSLLLSASYGS